MLVAGFLLAIAADGLSKPSDSQAIATSSWSKPKLLGWKDSRKGYGVNIAADGDHLSVAWIDARNTNDLGAYRLDVAVRESIDGGATWSKPEVISPDDGNPRLPTGAIVVDDGTIVVWHQEFETRPSAWVFAQHTAEGWVTQEIEKEPRTATCNLHPQTSDFGL